MYLYTCRCSSHQNFISFKTCIPKVRNSMGGVRSSRKVPEWALWAASKFSRESWASRKIRKEGTTNSSRSCSPLAFPFSLAACHAMFPVTPASGRRGGQGILIEELALGSFRGSRASRGECVSVWGFASGTDDPKDW